MRGKTISFTGGATALLIVLTGVIGADAGARAVRLEAEPNDLPEQAETLGVGDTVDGIAAYGNDDWFVTTVPTAAMVEFDVGAGLAATGRPEYAEVYCCGGTVPVPSHYDRQTGRVLVRAGDALWLRIAAPYGDTTDYSLTVAVSVPDNPATEAEPNDTRADANEVGVGPAVIVGGMIEPADETDYFQFEGVAGGVVSLDIGNSPRLEFQLEAADGSIIAPSPAEWAEPRRIYVHLPHTGRYFVRLRNFSAPADRSLPYSLLVRLTGLGPGDPTVVQNILPGDAHALDVIPAQDGELFVHFGFQGSRFDPFRDFIGRVDSDGSMSLVASDIGGAMGGPVDIELDGYGHLILAYLGPLGGGARLRRLDPASGLMSDFASEIGRFFEVAVGPEGDVWAYDVNGRIIRFDAWGLALDTIAAPAWPIGVGGLAFSPQGELHITSGGTIYRLDLSGRLVPVFSSQLALGPMAFDEDGNIYVGSSSGLLRLDAASQVVNRPFAVTNLGVVADVDFIRDAAGAPTNRLLAVSASGVVVEFAQGSVEQRGARVGADLTPLSLANVSRHLLARDVMHPADEALFDRHGNRNGRYDVGDMRAWMQSAGIPVQSGN